MAFSKNVKTYFEGTWHDGDVMVMRGADHGAWLGSSVFGGAGFGHRRLFQADAKASRLFQWHDAKGA